MSTSVESTIREHLRVNDSIQEPIEWEEMISLLEFDASRPRVAGGRIQPRAWAAIAAAAVVLLVFGLIPLFGGGEEPQAEPPAAPVAPGATASVDPDRVITKSEGMLGVSVEWTRVDPSGSALWSGLASDGRLFPGYSFNNAPAPFASIDGTHVFAIRDGLSYQLVLSSDAVAWDVEPALPNAPVMSRDFFAIPFLTAIDGQMQSLPTLLRWSGPEDAPDTAHFAYNDGAEWQQGSYSTEPILEFLGDSAGRLDQHWGCLQPDGGGGVIVPFFGPPEDPQQEQAYVLVTGTDSTWIPAPAGENPVLSCLDTGIYSVSSDAIQRLEADLRWSDVELPGGLATSLMTTEHTGMWATGGRFMAVLEDGLIWSTDNFKTWESIELPDEAAWILSRGGSVLAADIGWIVMDGLPGFTTVPEEGLWFSPDGQQWDLIPRPDFLGEHFITGPIDDLLLAHRGDSTRDIWIGRISSG